MSTATKTRLSPLGIARAIFIRVGVLPFMLAVALVVFSLMSQAFLTTQNLVNVGRQSVYLILVSMGQMLVLISGGFDLSVGMVIALSSVVSAMTMVALMPMFPDAVWLVIALGALAGLTVAGVIGAINGVGVAVFGVSPFIMTLGVASAGAGLALFLTGGVPVSNLPFVFGDTFGFGRVWNIPVPVLIAALVIFLMWIYMAHMRPGAQIYAVGGNLKAAHLSGIDGRRTLIRVYVMCAVLAGLTGLLLTARVETGDANMGSSMALESIAACVIAGVSLRGGIGRVENVVLGGFFIILVQNGMNLAQISSYLQMVVLGSLLILAVVFDQIRYRMLLGQR